MAATIPGARFVCLHDAGHLAYVEAPEAFTAALIEFLGAEFPGEAGGKS